MTVLTRFDLLSPRLSQMLAARCPVPFGVGVGCSASVSRPAAAIVSLLQRAQDEVGLQVPTWERGGKSKPDRKILHKRCNELQE